MTDPAELEIKSPKLTECLPKTFSGNQTSKIESQSHLLKFNDYLNFHRIDAKEPANLEEIIKRFKFTLDGKARLWINNIECTDFQTLQKRFIENFSPAETKFGLIKEYEGLSFAKENLDEHLKDLRRIGQELNYSDEQISHKFLLSLPAECQKFIVMTNPSGSLQEWVDAARSYMELEGKTSLQPPSEESHFFTQPEKKESAIAEELEFWKEKCKHLELQNRGRGQNRFEENRNRERPEFRAANKPFQQSSENKPFPRSSANQIPSVGNLIFSKDQGQSERNQENPYRPRIICHYCLQPGHKWRFCYKRQDDLKAKGEFQPPPEGPKSNANQGETNFQ